MRRFHLQRDEDASGVSGTGLVAEGVQFSDGTCALRWLTATASTALYASADDVVTIHGHEGRTRLVWADETPTVCGGAAMPTVNVEFRPGSPKISEAISRRMTVIARLGGGRA